MMDSDFFASAQANPYVLGTGFGVTPFGSIRVHAAFLLSCDRACHLLGTHFRRQRIRLKTSHLSSVRLSNSLP